MQASDAAVLTCVALYAPSQIPQLQPHPTQQTLLCSLKRVLHLASSTGFPPDFWTFLSQSPLLISLW